MNASAPPPVGYREQAFAPSRFPPMSPTTRGIYLMLVTLMSLAFFTTIGTWSAALIAASRSSDHAAKPDEALMTTGVIAMVVLIFLLYGQVAAGIMWMYKAWSWLPWQERYARNWRSWISPSQAALFLLIPYFHYYWMFVANFGLCDALDRLRVTYPTSTPAPRGLAIAACICQLVVPFPVGALLWLAYMSRIEKMTREMSASMNQRSLAF